jgi:hypothetical protein
MFKRLFFTAAAAAAVSVPLAGVAWATPANNDPPGQRDTPSGQPGIPGVVGQVADAFGTNPNPGQALPPGQVFSNLKGVYDGKNTPERYATAINSLTPFEVGETLSPGLGIKSGTPACKSGRTGGNLGLCN